MAPADGQGVSAILGAETGSGKTLAYLLPMLHHLKATDQYIAPETEESRSMDTAPDFLRPATTHTTYGPLAPRGLVLAPTHELTRQITAVVKSLCHELKLSSTGGSSTKIGVTKEGDVDVFAATGGTVRRMLRLKRDGEEIEEWDVKTRARRREADEEEGLEVEDEAEVDNTGRVREQKLRLRLDRVEWIVIDEADVMLGQSHPRAKSPDSILTSYRARPPQRDARHAQHDPQDRVDPLHDRHDASLTPARHRAAPT